ncbi:PEP-CTERM sorting domain-containing protein [Aeoliella sp. ICT_H6.2]|uniref:PEP-CTERM sorting domain-containing protein n=1 Tax=Aeoliella straminimaris TaxID=2954799 RepID=A0A9X2FAL1_9BACT|nr:PEP-CTERM sorting domain-containing protein [Aeoliella straminimaris]MCO6044678.1 PEP-CTERM sorting domain-containing protein [Aeoliella straminimaris]
MICRFISACSLALILSGYAHAASLLVDVNDRNASSPTQAGYLALTQDGVTGISTDFGMLDLTLTGTVGAALDDRDRGALDASQPLSDLLRDFVFISQQLDSSTGDPITGDGQIELTISGLDAGYYEFKGYFHDRSVDHVSGDIAVSTDGGGTFDEEIDDGLYSYGNDPLEVGMASFNFTATGTDPVVVRFTGQEGLFFISGSQAGNFLDQDSALISGFEIHQVPEPSTVALLLLGGAAIVACKLRQ